MRTTLVMRDGKVTFHCADCARDFPVDCSRPLVPQLRGITDSHHCSARPAKDEPDTVLTSMSSGG